MGRWVQILHGAARRYHSLGEQARAPDGRDGMKSCYAGCKSSPVQSECDKKRSMNKKATSEKKPNRETQIRRDMEALGIYQPIFDLAIHDLAKKERELRRAEKAWRDAYTVDGKRKEPQMVVQLVSKQGVPYSAKDPYYAVVQALQKDVAAQRQQLGLTPRSLQRVREQQKDALAAGDSKLEQLLDAAHEHAVEMAEAYQDEVDTFVDDILAGRKNVNLEQRQACERYMRDLQNPAWDFRAEAANDIIAIIETLMCHQKGEFIDARALRDTAFTLLPYHKFIVYNVLGFYLKRTNERRFKEALDFVPRKNIKTTFAACLAFALALYNRRSGSIVYEVGGELKQAMEGFNFLKYNLRRLGVTIKDDPVNGLRIIDNNQAHQISGDVGDGYIEINAIAKSGDSFNANIVIADEMHLYKDPSEYQLLKDACKAYTNKLIIGISSGGKLAQGFCAKRVEYGKKILDGTITGPAADSVFVFIAQAPRMESGDVDYRNPEVLEACNPGWGHSIRPQELINDAEQAYEDPQLRSEFLQKSLNVFTAQLKAWFDVEEWRRSDRKYNFTIEEAARWDVRWYGGTDLSKLHDLTASCLFTHYNGVDVLLPHCWFPIVAAAAKAQEDEIPLFGWKDDGWLTMTNTPTTNHSEVVRYYRERETQGFEYGKIGHDPKFVRKYFLEMEAEGFPIRNIPQTYLRKSEGFRYLENSAKNGTLYYFHAEPMEYCVGNVHGIEHADDTVEYEKVDEHHRIDVFDAAVFSVMAYLEDLERAEAAAGWWGNMK